MARSYLTTNAVLDAALSRLRTTSTDHRNRMLSWLNSAMVQVANERPWNFLEKTADINLSNSIIPLPDDFSSEQFIRIGTTTFTPTNILTEVEAGADWPGYTINEEGIEIFPGAAGLVKLGYISRVVTYADGATTVFPSEFLPLFERAILTAWYEYDVDGDRMPLSFQIDAKLLSQMKKVDNQRKPISRVNSHGYRRNLQSGMVVSDTGASAAFVGGVYTDIITGTRYQVVIVDGVLGTQEV